MDSYDESVAQAKINYWNKITNRLVGASSLPFSILVLPQMVQNVVSIVGGNPNNLTAISWMVSGKCALFAAVCPDKPANLCPTAKASSLHSPEYQARLVQLQGYGSALLGNTLMCSHFASRGELSAVAVQLVGITNNLLILSQLAWVTAMPITGYWFLASVAVAGSAACWARIRGMLKQPFGDTTLTAWQCCQIAAGVMGLSVVPQVRCSRFL